LRETAMIVSIIDVIVGVNQSKKDLSGDNYGSIGLK
jgi:hypothetical protein